jgi:hypothetical protein
VCWLQSRVLRSFWKNRKLKRKQNGYNKNNPVTK